MKVVTSYCYSAMPTLAPSMFGWGGGGWRYCNACGRAGGCAGAGIRAGVGACPCACPSAVGAAGAAPAAAAADAAGAVLRLT